MSVEKWTQCPTSRINNIPPPCSTSNVWEGFLVHTTMRSWWRKCSMKFIESWNKCTTYKIPPFFESPCLSLGCQCQAQRSQHLRRSFPAHWLSEVKWLKSLRLQWTKQALWKSSMDSWSLASKTTTLRTDGLYNLRDSGTIYRWPKVANQGVELIVFSTVNFQVVKRACKTGSKMYNLTLPRKDSKMLCTSSHNPR